MSTLDELGLRLFRRRSLLPLLLLPPAFLAIRQGGVPLIPIPLAVGVSLVGLIGRALVIGVAPHQTSGRLTNRFQARLLVTTGAYSLLRHPLYVANGLVFAGPVSAVGSPWFLAVCALLFILFYGVVIRAEEAFLAERFGEAHRRWTARTPALLPDPRRFQPAELPFSLTTVIRREYSTWLLVVALFAAVDRLGARFHGREAEPTWTYAFLLSVGGALVVKLLKYRTRRLHVDGR